MRGDSTPGVLRIASERHGSTAAIFDTERKCCSSGFSVRRRAMISKIDSMHSVARRSTVGIALGSTTLSMGALYTRVQDHSVIAVRFLPPDVLKSSPIKATREVAGAAAATPTR